MKPRSIATLFACCIATAAATSNSAEFTQVLDLRVQTDVGWAPELRLIDLNNDGNIDIFYNGSGAGVAHYLGDGSGLFSEPVNLLQEDSSYLPTLMADFNNDGHADLFSQGFYPSVGGVAYDQKIEANSGLVNCSQWHAIDVNSDSYIDIVCSVDVTTDNVFARRFGFRTFLNEGNFNFSEMTSYYGAYALENAVSVLAVGDINNDSKDDIDQVARMLSRNAAGTGTKIEHHRVTSHLNQEDIPHNLTASFTTLDLHDSANAWSGATIKSAQLVDVNNDGNLDLALRAGSGNYPTSLTGYLAVLTGNGDGTFNQQVMKTQLGSQLISDFELTDFNDDGAVDLLVSYWYNHELENQLGLTLSYGRGDGTFETPKLLSTDFEVVWQVDAADINGNGMNDIIAVEHWHEGGNLVGFSMNATLAEQQPFEIVCESITSDSDGDGWGWENNQSCTVTSDSNTAAPLNTTTLLPRNPEIPFCAGQSADEDGDGWGWENGATCQVEEQVDLNHSVLLTRPVCQYPWRDSDGDGWGYENGESCVVSL